jgi:hypothetical protein
MPELPGQVSQQIHINTACGDQRQIAPAGEYAGRL